MAVDHPAAGLIMADRVWLALLRWLAACRILSFPRRLIQLWSLDFLRPYFERDPFFFLTHDYYLSRDFTLGQRVDCALAHYSFEGQNHGPAYHRSVYQSPGGLVLWHRVEKGVRCMIVLRATEDNRYEGDLSVLCLVNDVRVCRVSFSYVDGKVFGLAPERTIFVTRNQTDRNAELDLFRATFRHNSPPYFCAAAVCGIAMANGMCETVMVKHDAQIAYAERYAEGFKQSYSALWEALGAREIDGRHAYRMSIPLKLPPITDVKLKHRNRAIARRRNWLEIALSARQAMLEDRTSRTPLPIEGEADALLPPLN